MIADTIRYLLSNFTLTFLVLGAVSSAIAVARAPRPLTAPVVVEKVFSYFILFNIVFHYWYNAYFHIVYGDMAATFIGWPQSPFQTEVGVASIAFGALGLLAFRGGFQYRVAAIVAITINSWGAACGHLYQIWLTGNLAPGNAGPILYTAITIPFIALALLWLQYRYAHPRVPVSVVRATR